VLTPVDEIPDDDPRWPRHDILPDEAYPWDLPRDHTQGFDCSCDECMTELAEIAAMNEDEDDEYVHRG
jgi:hypothetical protein